MKRENNFDILRLTLAAVVVLFHIGYISGSPALAMLPRYFSGHLAVEGFFAISGFLIFASYERSAGLADYALKRAARILPGYWLAAAFCVAIAFASGSVSVGRFLAADLSFATFLHPAIPGVFESNPVTDVMNGALWTIKIEVMFYAAVPAIVWLCRKLHRDAVLWTLFALSIAYRIGFARHESLDVQLPGQLSFFMAGALIHYHLDFFLRQGKWLMLAAALAYGLHLLTGWYVLRPAAVAALTLGASLLLPVVKGPTRWGDFSYGAYVLHWPIIQLLAATSLYLEHPWLGVAVTLLLVALGAAASWFAVEKPSLALAHSRRLKARTPAVSPI
jgi:peptidoglycan/LPS O-acetylase OafA/YrhL